MSITSEIERIQNAKNDIATSLTNKGVDVPAEARIDEYASLIDEMKAGGEYQAKSATPSDTEQLITPDEGYDALSRVVIAKTPLEEQTVTPTANGFIVEPSGENIGMSKVTVMGDYNLTSSNIKDGVAIFGVTGSYGGSGESGGGDSFYELGTSVSVYARNSFRKGEIFMGEKNPDPQASMVYDILNATSYIRAWNKNNLDVVVLTTSPKTTSTEYVLGIYNKENNEYERIPIEVPSGYLTSNFTTNNGNTLVDDTASKIIIPQSDNSNVFNLGFLIVNVNKSAKTGSITKVLPKDIGAPQYPITFEYEGVTYDNGKSFMSGQTQGVFVKDYFITRGNLYSSSIQSGGKQIACLIALKYTQGTFKFHSILICKDNIGAPSRSTFRMISDDEAVAMCGNYGVKFNFGESGITTSIRFEITDKTSQGSSYSVTNLSKNGKYACASISTTANRVYEVDFSTGTYNTIYTIQNAAYCDSTGEYVFDISSGQPTGTIYKNGQVFLQNVKSCSDDYFEFTSDDFYIHAGADTPYKCCRNPEDYDYFIYNTQAYIETADRIYGIVPESMAMGDVGRAQGLFNTFGLNIANGTT